MLSYLGTFPSVAIPSEAEHSSELRAQSGRSFQASSVVKYVSSSAGMHTRALGKTAQPSRLVEKNLIRQCLWSVSGRNTKRRLGLRRNEIS